MLEYLKDFPFVQMCLPDKEQEIKKMGRQYIINVFYTRMGEKFKLWIDERVDKRHEEIKVNGNKYIELDEEIAQAFLASKAVSTGNGNAFHLFKPTAKRRRTKQEIEEAKLEEQRKQADVELKMGQFAAL